MDYSNNSEFKKKEGQGSLFINDKKSSPNQPDFTGSVVIGGVDKRIAAWKRTAKNGNTYLSISVSDFQVQQSATSNRGTAYPQQSIPTAPPPGIEDMPDFGSPLEDLPF